MRGNTMSTDETPADPPAEEKPAEEKAAEPAKSVGPNCTRCEGTAYSYRNHTVAGVPGMIVYCTKCGGIFSWSPKPK
jgi:hypothetical protein